MKLLFFTAGSVLTEYLLIKFYYWVLYQTLLFPAGFPAQHWLKLLTGAARTHSDNVTGSLETHQYHGAVLRSEVKPACSSCGWAAEVVQQCVRQICLGEGELGLQFVQSASCHILPRNQQIVQTDQNQTGLASSKDLFQVIPCENPG
ncbi:hypothetical protein ILYODFUR_006426 [Ilyodon furcidens]|uniref:Uncharacterized protein n=1 Tax=Ilyodon furcidens TaxID=33524 RepID=A0ABV0URF5_9TELE